MKRVVNKSVTGFRTIDGAGVNLVRVLGHQTTKDYDPILMLDSFDSQNPEDYIAGFPMHPHRGIETISYIYSGKMTHRDSLGNEDTIGNGEVQWMTAGSGIMHEEKLPHAGRMLGVQLWLNMPAKDKMAPPAYNSVKNDHIKEITFDGGKLRLLAGKYGKHVGHEGKYLPIDFYDIHLDRNSKFTIEMEHDKSVILFTLIGDIEVEGKLIKEKTAAILSEGTEVTINSLDDNVQVLFISSNRLDEPISWGGPIVMNTREELKLAFAELNRGTFLKSGVEY